MTPIELKTRLEQAGTSDDFYSASELIGEDLVSSGAGLEAVAVILAFMEEHPAIDFGSPGPLVHFVEKFYRAGYEELLLSSLCRHPTVHTVWMLNRVVNGTKTPEERNRLADAMRTAGSHPLATVETREAAEHYLERLEQDT